MRTVLRTLLRGVTPLVLALAAGCALAPATASPAGPAARIVEGCRPPEEYRERQECYEEALLAHQRAAGVEAAMRMLDSLAAREPEVKREGHVYAHAIGLAAYATAAEVGRTFARCDPSHQSGCHHGVIQAYFVDAQRSGSGIDEQTVNALCADHRGPGGNAWLLMQCTHGMGHGLVAFHGHDLPRALRDCDLLSSPFEREACYGAAFMENVVNATMPHHPAAGGGGEHAHAGHAAGGHDQAHAPFRALDPDDPLYPCTAVERRYWNACYSMQTSAILFRNGWDLPAAARACEKAPREVRRTCFTSLGRDISGAAVHDPAEAIRRCSLLDDSIRHWCHVGAATTALHVTARADDGLAYCRMLRDARAKAECYEAVGRELVVLERTAAAREVACGRAEEEHVGACRRGAGLPGQEPRPAAAPQRTGSQ